MGTVHGVYLKYVGLSAISYAGYSMLMQDEYGESISLWQLLGYSAGKAVASLLSDDRSSSSSWRVVPILILGYSTILNGAIAILFKTECGMRLIGKDRKTGRIPRWSYIVFFPFHLPTMLYTHIHTMMKIHKGKKEDGQIVYERVPVVTEVQPGWWVGGCYAHELDKDWAGVIDLTVEFPETTIHRTSAYLSIPTWDGIPASPEQIEEAANFAVTASQCGDVLVHCAHGRGRSTTIMCACLVKAGLFPTWEESFAQGIKPQRSVCKLNKRMRQNLTEWQATYIDRFDKKGQ